GELATGVGGRYEHDPTIDTTAFAADQPFVFEAIENTHHSTGTDVDFPADRRGRHRTIGDHRAQTHQLRRGDVADRGQLARMQGDRSRDAAQGAQNAQVVLL